MEVLMRMRSAVLLPLALSLMCAASVAAERKPGAKATRNLVIRYSGEPVERLTPERKERLQQYAKDRAALLLQTFDCTPVYQAGGVCVIELEVGLVSDAKGNPYCVVPFPEEIQLGTGDDRRKTIVWSLIPPSSGVPANTTFTFFDDRPSRHKAKGIIIVSDAQKQLNDGVLGDGTVNPPASRWMVEHKFQKNRPNTAVYIPLIVRTDDPGGPNEKIAVCGTPDPKIGNN
jgi:hypothetical protein